MLLARTFAPCFSYQILWALWVASLAGFTSSTSSSSNCQCGYLDPVTRDIFTDATIVYFNETSAIPSSDFIQQEYIHGYEKNWNSLFREGASIANLDLSNGSKSTLDLHVSPYTAEHVVVGSEISTTRQDIKYGSFRALLQSPGPWAGGGGSALSLEIKYNVTQSISIDLQNANHPADASVSMLLGDESPGSQYAVTYASMAQAGFELGSGVDPWESVELRIDWTEKEVRFYVGGSLARKISCLDESLPSVPSAVYLRHSSNGDPNASQGPPIEKTVASAAWMRFFYNSSLTQVSKRFNESCTVASARPCLITNDALRQSSPYIQQSTAKWIQLSTPFPKRVPAIWLSVSCICFTALLLVKPITRRVKERLQRSPKPISVWQPGEEHIFIPDGTTAWTEICGDYSKRLLNTLHITQATFPKNKSITQGNLVRSGSTDTIASLAVPAIGIAEKRASGEKRSSVTGYFESKRQSITLGTIDKFRGLAPPRCGRPKVVPPRVLTGLPVPDGADLFGYPVPATPLMKSNSGQTAKRVDHLAGLLAVASLLITAIHFCLTFVPASIDGASFTHYTSETIARKAISPFLLNQDWIGPFFVVSARFLTTKYLRSGELLSIAERIIMRPPRLMIPVVAIAALEYFFMSSGTTSWLECLPSITWSTWPFAVPYPNFGIFLNELLELIYLIPNAVPRITDNYCTGILWSISVLLQNSWTTLLAVIVIHEIKTPWKRFCYYAFCIINHWYALSWGSYFYFGILLTDLDITYNYHQRLTKRPMAHYSFVIGSALLSFAGLFVICAVQFKDVDYPTYEYGIHPDPASGLPIAQAGLAYYPPYFIPRLNGIVFTFGLLLLIEISPMVQKLFSVRPLQWIFPHIFTIYLFHGYLFWSLGAFLCIRFNELGVPYWTNILCVALICYAVLAVCVWALTPALNVLGKTVTHGIWNYANGEQLPRMPTLFPYPSDFFTRRDGG